MCFMGLPLHLAEGWCGVWSLCGRGEGRRVRVGEAERMHTIDTLGMAWMEDARGRRATALPRDLEVRRNDLLSYGTAHMWHEG